MSAAMSAVSGSLTDCGERQSSKCAGPWLVLLPCLADCASIVGTEVPPTLRICGSIDAAMPHVQLPGVSFMGVVPRLWDYYDDADLVLLPVISGGGVAIKTLEAVLHERPVLATRHALRGLPDDVARSLGHEDDPIRYAASLLQIVTDSARHQEQLERSRMSASLLRAYSFGQTLADALDAVGLGERRFTLEFKSATARLNDSDLT